jgi:hypothetical protein
MLEQALYQTRDYRFCIAHHDTIAGRGVAKRTGLHHLRAFSDGSDRLPMPVGFSDKWMAARTWPGWRLICRHQL